MEVLLNKLRTKDASRRSRRLIIRGPLSDGCHFKEIIVLNVKQSRATVSMLPFYMSGRRVLLTCKWGGWYKSTIKYFIPLKGLGGYRDPRRSRNHC